MPLRIIESLKEDQEIVHEGDLHIQCPIPPRVKIQVKNGSLTVDGDVGEGSILKLDVSMDHPGMPAITRGVFSSGSVNIVAGNIVLSGVRISAGHSPTVIFSERSSGFVSLPSYKLNINGNLAAGVKIQAETPVSCRNIGARCVIRAGGNIDVGEVGPESELSTENANITAANVYEQARLATNNGGIRALNIAKNARLTTNNGQIQVENVDQAAELISSNAPITARNVASGVTLHTSNARIKAGDIKEGARLATSNAEISVGSAEDPSCMSTSNANVYIAGKAQPNKGRAGSYRREFDFGG